MPVTAHALQKSGWTASAPAKAEKFQPRVVAKAETEESEITLSPDASEFFWGVSRQWFPMSRISEIWTARRKGSGWAAQRAPFSVGFSDGDPFVSHDGKQIFFVSMRPVNGPPRKDFDIWVVDRIGDGYGPPRNLGPSINSPHDELYPSVAGDGTIYFASEREGPWKIFRARRLADGSYAPAELLPEPVNVQGAWNFNPYVTQDGRTLVFTSQRKSGAGKGDIWVADMGSSNEFQTARNLGPSVNTAEEEFHPSLSPDKRALFFVRRGSGPGANADIHWISTAGMGIAGR
jgi:Tol biopolymer transport system component